MSSRKVTDTRTAILDAARSLFEIHGYSEVGLEAVATKAGVSRQAIYLHFSSRAELLRALHQRVFEQDVEPAVCRVWEAKTADAGLGAWIAASAKVIPKIVAIGSALDAPRRVDPEVAATWKAPEEGRHNDCLRMARWLQSDGNLAPGVKVGEAADLLWSLTSIRAYQSLVVDRAWSVNRWARWLGTTLRVLLCGVPPPGRKANRKR